MIMTFNFRALLVLCSVAALPLMLAAAPASTSSADKERDLIAVLRSDAPAAEKAITCKKLAIYGSKNAVEVLAPLLLDKDLASWSRIALEVIPDPSASEALRAAIPKLQGRLLVGVINSIGVRRDPQAVSDLSGKLKDGDLAIVSATAEALGHIGGSAAAKALEAALVSSESDARSAVAYGCVLCAESLLANGQADAAASLCDRVRSSDVPKQRIVEATRGAILARKSGGIPLLLEQLRSPDFALFGIGVRTARELPGRDVTQAIATELDRANADRQGSLLLALADRTDAAVLPKVLQVAESGSKPLRKTALGLLDGYRDLACVPVLLNASAETDPDLARIAKSSLARLGGKEVDADLLARLRLASGPTRQVLIELAGQRRIDGAVPVLVRSMEDPDAKIRRAAVESVGLLGTEQQAASVIRLLSSAQSADDRDDIERALSAICRRAGQKSLSEVMPLAKTGDANLRKVGLRALSSIGGGEALAIVQSAISDPNESIQDEAVNLLSTWPNTWPDDEAVAEPLLTLAKSGKKPSHQVQGLRGYLQYIEENKKLSNEAKVAKISELLAVVKGAEEKRQVISVIGTLPTAPALELLLTLASDDAVAEEAYLAASKIASDRKLNNLELRRKALQTIVAKSQNEATKKKAADALSKIK